MRGALGRPAAALCEKPKDESSSYVSLFWRDRRDGVMCVCVLGSVCVHTVQKNVRIFYWVPEATVSDMKIWSVFNDLWVTPFTVWEIMSLWVTAHVVLS